MIELGKALQAEYERLFGSVDFNADDVPTNEPVYECETCSDTGYVRYDLPYGHPQFGKLHACPNPHCPIRRRRAVERVEKFKASSDWEDDYNQWTFESFVALLNERFTAVKDALPEKARKQGVWQGKRGGYAAARYFAEHVGEPFTLALATQQYWKAPYPGENAYRPAHSLVLRGDVGLGKTGLAVAAGNTIGMNGQAVVFARVQSIIQRIQGTYNSASVESLEDVLGFYSNAPVLIIDEFGLEQYAADRLEKFEEILRARDRKNLPFLLTTNLTFDEMYTLWHPRIADVVAKAHWVAVGGVKLRDTATRNEEVW